MTAGDEDSVLTILEPGDRVLVVVPEDLPPDSAHDMLDRLGDAFPGVAFTVLAGARRVIVQRPDTNGGAPPDSSG